MSILWHWTSNIWLRVLIELNMSPVVVQMAAESAIWMSVLWHWASNVWLRILSQLHVGPIVMKVA
jgi:hypothetical protein